MTAGRETSPPVTKQYVALMMMRPERVCTKRQRKRIIDVKRQHGTRIAIPPYLEQASVYGSGAFPTSKECGA